MEGGRIALRDIMVVGIECQRKRNADDLATQFSNVRERAVSNAYLKDVLEDYRRYYKGLLEQKQRQQAMLEQILGHIDGAGQAQQRSLTLANEDAVERKQLLAEIGKVKREIDVLLSALDE